MAAIARRLIGFLAGAPTTTSVPVLVASFSNVADIVVTAYPTAARTGAPSATVTITAGALAKLGDDRGAADPAGQTWACYFGHGTLSGLVAGTRYYLTLVQGATTESDPTSCTAAAAGTDFRVYFTGCDFAQYTRDGNPAGDSLQGYWPEIKLQVESALATRPAYVVFCDDLGYADGPAQGYPGFADTGTGKAQTNQAYLSLKQYDYALTYLALLGMLETLSEPAVAWGRESGRNWCVRNMPWLVQWGDHEFFNNIGWNGQAASADPWFAPGKAVWNALFGPLRPTPTIQVRDLLAQPWAWTCGDLRVVAPDGVSRLESSSPFDQVESYRFVKLFGADQIDDILDALNTAAPFKILAAGIHGERYWLRGANFAVSRANAQTPMETCQPDEWLRLLFATGNSPKSVMDNPATNGRDGVFIRVLGDLHIGQVQMHVGFATGNYGTGLKARWTSWYTGTQNRGHIFIDPECAENIRNSTRSPFLGQQMLYHPLKAVADLPVYPGPVYGYFTTAWTVRADVRGSAVPKEVQMTLLGIDSAATAPFTADNVPQELYTAVFRPGDNLPARPPGRPMRNSPRRLGTR